MTVMGQALRRVRSAASPPDGSVVAHPAFRQVPKALFPLRSDAANAEYDTLARLLFERGRMTVDAHRTLSSYAMKFDAVTLAAAEGRPLKGLMFAQMDKDRRRLRLDELDKPVAAPQDAPANRFARTGRPLRR